MLLYSSPMSTLSLQAIASFSKASTAEVAVCLLMQIRELSWAVALFRFFKQYSRLCVWITKVEVIMKVEVHFLVQNVAW